MDENDGAATIARAAMRTVFDSLGRPLSEFVVTLDDGTEAWGSAPAGETRSRFETAPSAPEVLASATSALLDDGALAGVAGQRAVDQVLAAHRSTLGPNGTLGISVAYLNASANRRGVPPFVLLREMAGPDVTRENPRLPVLLLNVLNGGAHARTNPVQSDFPEFLLVPSGGEPEDYLDAFHSVLAEVRRALDAIEVVDVRGTPVHAAVPRDNRTWIELLLGVLQRLALDSRFGLMIDVSAGDLEAGGIYRFSRTDDSVMDRDQMVAYWSKVSSEYPLAMLEDPLAEDDPSAWQDLHAVGGPMLVGDNLTNTDVGRITDAGVHHRVDAVLIKPNQAGTVTGTVDAVLAARAAGLSPIPSHRSIETDVPWLADVCHAFEVEWTKLGLLSDFATIQKLNRLMRYRGDARGEGR